MTSKELSSTAHTSRLSPTTNTSFCTIGTHIRRAFMCQIGMVTPTPKESKALNEKNVTLDVLQSYYVWRRSGLMFALPFIALGVIFGFMDMIHTLGNDNVQTLYNGFGKTLLIIQNIDSLFLFAGIVGSYVSWNQLIKSIRILRYAFLVSSIMPLIRALFPLEMTLNNEINNAIRGDKELQSIVFVLKLQLSLGYLLTLLPVIISLPGGALRASLRIRWFVPESLLSGWILLMSAPFYSLLICITLIIVLQVSGNFVLFIGTLLVVSAPWVYVAWGGLFVRLWNDDDKKLVFILQRISGITSILGYVVIIIFSFTGNVSGVRFVGNASEDSDLTYLVSYSQAARVVIETFGRLVTTTICFSDIILRMNLESWNAHEASKLQDTEDIDRRYRTLMEAFLPTKAAETDAADNTTTISATDECNTDGPEIGSQEPVSSP